MSPSSIGKIPNNQKSDRKPHAPSRCPGQSAAPSGVRDCGGSVMCISWDTLNQCNNNGAKNWGKIFQRTSVKNQYINF